MTLLENHLCHARPRENRVSDATCTESDISAPSFIQIGATTTSYDIANTTHYYVEMVSPGWKAGLKIGGIGGFLAYSCHNYYSQNLCYTAYRLGYMRGS